MRTTIYVDGLNLYYGCLKNTPYKWLDLHHLCATILAPHHNIKKIRYFTAIVHPKKDNPKINDRQKAYLNALRTLPNLHIHLGNFSRWKRWMDNASPPPDKVRVIRIEEKQSDVNFVAHLLNDAWKDEFDCAVLITNDSDMVGGMRLVRQEFPEKRLGLITPYQKTSSNDESIHTPKLKKFAHFSHKITQHHLLQAQFPNPVITPQATPIYKPPSW